VVTLYATLGDDAVVHGINETECEYVMTSYDLLPKFKTILANTPTVKHLVYMEDPLKKGDTTGYKAGVKIHTFCDVITLGAKSGKGTLLNEFKNQEILKTETGSGDVSSNSLLFFVSNWNSRDECANSR